MSLPQQDWTDIDLTGVTLLGVYQVRHRLARGGMGTVWLAENVTLGVPVAVKVPDPGVLLQPGFRARFLDEVRALTRFSHPNIVRILAAGEHEGVPYYVLEYLAGGSLKDRLVPGTQAERPRDVLAWAWPIARALDHLHAQGLVHRDVKPSNILFQESGNPVLSDFGIAKVLGDTGTGATTSCQVFTPTYAAPEQVVGELTPALATRIDQYALACTVYEALVGSPPYDGSAGHVLAAKVRDPVPDPRLRVPDLSRAACDAVVVALLRDPSQRHASCTAFLTALDEGLSEPVAVAVPVVVPVRVAPVPAGRSARTTDGARGTTAPDSRRGPPSSRPALARPAVLVLAIVAAALIAWALVRPENRAGSPVGNGATSKVGETGSPQPAVTAEAPLPAEPAGGPEEPAAPAAQPVVAQLLIESPAEDDVVEQGPLEVRGTVAGTDAQAVLVNGVQVPVQGGRWRVELDTGAVGVLILEAAIEGSGSERVAVLRRVRVALSDVRLLIESPTLGQIVTSREVPVRGRVVGRGVRAVQVQGVEVPLTEGRFEGAARFTSEGLTRIGVAALRVHGPSIEGGVEVVVDTTPPRIESEFVPNAETLVASADATVEVRVVDAAPRQVRASGQVYAVPQDGVVRIPITLVPGRRKTITVVAFDAGGLASEPVEYVLRTQGARVLAVPAEFASLRAALEAAKGGDTIELAPGEYDGGLSARKSVKVVGVPALQATIISRSPGKPVLVVEPGMRVELQGVRLRGEPGPPAHPPGWIAEGVEWSQPAWTLHPSVVPPGSALGRAGLGTDASVVRVGAVDVKDEAHIVEAYFGHATGLGAFDLTYSFKGGKSLVEACRCSALVVVNDGFLECRTCSLEVAAHVGVLAAGPAASFLADDCDVTQGLWGLVATRGARMRVAACRLRSQTRSGVLAVGRGAVLDASNCSFSECASAGLQVIGGVEAHVIRCLVTGCGDGVSACGPDARVDLLENTANNNAIGIALSWGTAGLVRGNTCDGNSWAGIMACGLGTTPHFSLNKVRKNQRFGVLW